MPITLKTIDDSDLISTIESRAEEIRLDLKYSLLFAFEAESISDLSRDALILLYKIVFSLSSYQEMRQSSRTKYFYLGVDFKGKPIGCLKNSFTKEGARRIFFLIDPEQNTITLVSAALMSTADGEHHVKNHIKNYFDPIVQLLNARGSSWEEFQSRTIQDIWPETEAKAESTASINEEELEHELRSQLHQLNKTLESSTHHLYHEEFSARRLVGLLQCFSRLITLRKQSAEDENLDAQIEQALLRSAFLFSKIFDISDIQIHFDSRDENSLQLVYTRGNKTQRHDIVSDNEQTTPNEVVSELLKYTEDFLSVSSIQLSVEHSEEDEVKHSDELIPSIESEKQLSNFAHCVYASWFMIPETALQLTRDHLSAFPPQNRNLLFSLLKYPDKLILHSESVLFLVRMIMEDAHLVHLMNRESARNLLTMAVTKNTLTEEMSSELLKTCFEKLKHLVSLAHLKQIKRTADSNGVKLPEEIEKQLRNYKIPKVKKEFKGSSLSSSVKSNVKTDQEIKTSEEEGDDKEDILRDIKVKVTSAISTKSENVKKKHWSKIKEKLRGISKKNAFLPSGLFKHSFLSGNSMSLYGLAYHHVKGNVQLLTLLEDQAKHLSSEDRNKFFKSALPEILKASDWKTFERLLLSGFQLKDNNGFFIRALAKVIKRSDWETFERLLLSGFQAENYRYNDRIFIDFIISDCIEIRNPESVDKFINLVKKLINSVELLGGPEDRLQSFMDSSLHFFILAISKIPMLNNNTFFHKAAEYLITSGADPNSIFQRNIHGYNLDVSIIDSAIATSILRSLLNGSIPDFNIPTLLLKRGAIPVLGINSLLFRHCLKGPILKTPAIEFFYKHEYTPYIHVFIENMKPLMQKSCSENDESELSLESLERDETSNSLSEHGKQLIESIPISLRNHPILIQWRKSFELNPLSYFSPNLNSKVVLPFDFLSLDAFIFYMATPLHLSLLFQQDELTQFLLIHSRGVHITLEPETVEKLIQHFELPWTEEQLSNASLLHLAVLTGNQYAFAQLLDQGADPNVKNAKGEIAKNMILGKLEQLMEEKKSENQLEGSQQLQAEIDTYRCKRLSISLLVA